MLFKGFVSSNEQKHTPQNQPALKCSDLILTEKSRYSIGHREKAILVCRVNARMDPRPSDSHIVGKALNKLKKNAFFKKKTKRAQLFLY